MKTLIKFIILGVASFVASSLAQVQQAIYTPDKKFSIGISYDFDPTLPIGEQTVQFQVMNIMEGTLFVVCLEKPQTLFRQNENDSKDFTVSYQEKIWSTPLFTHLNPCEFKNREEELSGLSWVAGAVEAEFKYRDSQDTLTYDSIVIKSLKLNYSASPADSDAVTYGPLTLLDLKTRKPKKNGG